MTALVGGVRTAPRFASRSLLRHRWAAILLTVTTVVVILAKIFLEGRVIINRTPSVPRGIYWLSRGAQPKRGEVVAFPIPEHVRALFRERQLVPKDFFTLLAKPVAAIGGDHVCVRAGHVFIEEQLVGTVTGVDSHGRPMPHVELCRPLAAGEVFVLTPTESFDSRYLGPISTTAVLGSLTLLIEL